MNNLALRRLDRGDEDSTDDVAAKVQYRLECIQTLYNHARVEFARTGANLV